MRYRYLHDFPRGISVFAILSYGIAVLGTPQCPPLYTKEVCSVVDLEVVALEKFVYLVPYCQVVVLSWSSHG